VEELEEVLGCPNPQDIYNEMHGEVSFDQENSEAFPFHNGEEDDELGEMLDDDENTTLKLSRPGRESSVLGGQAFDASWDQEDLSQWLKEIGYPECATYFADAGLEAMDLVHLEVDDLAEVVEDPKRRRRLIKRLNDTDVYDFLQTFTTAEVCDWIQHLGFESMVPTITDNELNGADVIELLPDEIASFLGVNNTEDAKYLHRMMHWQDTFEPQFNVIDVEETGVAGDMTCSDLCDWLSENGLHTMTPVVASENLDGADVLELTANELELLFGVPDAQGAWNKIHGAVEAETTTPFESSWSCGQVCNWMIAEGYGQFVAPVHDRDLNARAMRELSMDDMHTLLGFPEVQIRQELVRKIHNKRVGEFHRGMTSFEVVGWFEAQGFSDQANMVRVNDLDGADMFELELEEIVELLGVPETAAANFHAQMHP